jgi:hypothetical protein
MDWRGKMSEKSDKKPDFEEKTTSLVKIEDMSLEEERLAEQLYYSAGLDPVVDAGLKDYDKRLQQEMKLINKVFGPRGSDIRGYGESVAKRVAFAVYSLLNKQYGGKVGDLGSYIMALEDERDRASTRYDELMGRVVGILGEEYKELRTDSKVFMEKLTTVLGEDLKEAKIDQAELAERLAGIDGLRAQIKTLDNEKKELSETYESRLADLETKVKGLESEKAGLTGDLELSRQEHNRLKAAVSALAGAASSGEMGKKLSKELHSYLLKDSRIPDAVIEGVGKFINFEKYLGIAADMGAEEIAKRIEEILGTAQGKASS